MWITKHCAAWQKMARLVLFRKLSHQWTVLTAAQAISCNRCRVKIKKRTRYKCQNVWRHPCWHLSTLDSIYAWISDVQMISGRGWGHHSSSYPGSYHQGAVRVKTVPLIGRRRTSISQLSISQLCVHFTIVRPFHNPHVHFLSAAHHLGSGWLAADMIGGNTIAHIAILTPFKCWWTLCLLGE